MTFPGESTREYRHTETRNWALLKEQQTGKSEKAAEENSTTKGKDSEKK